MCHDFRNDRHFDHNRWRGQDHGPRREFVGHDRMNRDGFGPGPRDYQPENDFERDFGFQRKFINRAETVEALEWYLNELENEAQGVREAIEDLLIEIELDQEDFDDEEDGEQTFFFEEEVQEPVLEKENKPKKARKK